MYNISIFFLKCYVFRFLLSLYFVTIKSQFKISKEKNEENFMLE
jgi:hypothetical protein